MTKTFRCYYNEGYVEADCTAQHELCWDHAFLSIGRRYFIKIS
jgi:hypothetical protein